jgi:hypothetical protein
MEKIVCVECWADRYFFGQLLNDFQIVRKEKNKNEVIKAITERVGDKFLIGIVDEDRKDTLKIPKLKDFKLLKTDRNHSIYKHKINFQFIFVLFPVAFESWLFEFLKSQNKSLEDFDYNDFETFKKEVKSESIHKVEKYKNIVSFVIKSYKNSDNHIHTIKKQLEYLIEKKYQFNEIEFLQI